MALDNLLKPQDPNKTYLFRYDKQDGGFDGIFMPRLVLRNFEVIKETPLSYIIANPGSKRNRAISKTGKKRYAYPTVAEALSNCRHRTRKAIAFQRMNLERQEQYAILVEVEGEKMKLATRDIGYHESNQK